MHLPLLKKMCSIKEILVYASKSGSILWKAAFCYRQCCGTATIYYGSVSDFSQDTVLGFTRKKLIIFSNLL
jgi:hypothetical protein